MIHQEHGAAVFALIDGLVDRLAPAPAYRALFTRAIVRLREAADGSATFLPIDLPMAVADVLARPDEERYVSAAASTMLWGGADLMDDAADRQLPAHWKGVPASQIALVATNLLSTLPHLVVGAFDDGDGSTSSVYSQAVSQTLFAMSDGQAADLESSATVATVDDYTALVRRKSGAEFGLFAATPAILAGADTETVNGWIRFGFALGTMVQVFSDTVSTLTEGPRNDLLAGKRSLPVLLALAAAGDEVHKSLSRDLDMARQGDQDAVERAIGTMSKLGSVRASLEHVEVLRFRAAKALPVPLAGLSRTHALRVLLHSCSVF